MAQVSKRKQYAPKAFAKKAMLYFTQEQWDSLGAISSETDAPISALVRRAVDEFLARRKNVK